MGIRVQPADIEIPEQDPFKNDLLGRREPVEVLANLLRSIEGPCVLAVDAAWGAGKTTFLKILSQHLRNQGFRAIEFNAWETDTTEDPFLALSQELSEGLRQGASGSLRTKLNAMKSAAKEVLRRALPGTIRIATAGVLDLSSLIEKEAGNALATFTQAKIDNYLESKKSFGEFKASLRQLAAELAGINGLPLIVVIDELDRCRPTYAVELLETAKHLFTVDHVLFVLAVNRSQLSHSIRAVYGSEFDAPGYLRRFFDIDFRLPDSKRGRFVQATLTSTGIGDYFRSKSEDENYEAVTEWLAAVFEAFDVSLRSIGQSIHHLGLVCASLNRDRQSLPAAVTLASMLRTLDPIRYRRFTRGELEDREVVDYLLRSRSTLTTEVKYHLEAAIIVAAMEVRGSGSHYERAEPSSLLKGYRETVEGAQNDDRHSDPIVYAQQVLDMVDWYLGDRRLPRTRGLGFKEAVRRLELISPSLMSGDGQ